MNFKQRINKVAKQLETINRGNVLSGDCVFRNALGQILLLEKHNIKTQLVFGDFVMNTSKRPQDALSYGSPAGVDNPLDVSSTGSWAAHAWLTNGAKVIDFCWATFPDIVRAQHDWQWTIPERRVYIGPASSSELKNGCVSYQKWDAPRQAAIREEAATINDIARAREHAASMSKLHKQFGEDLIIFA